MAYHDPDLFFVVYLAYVNMSLLDQKYFELIPELMDQGILKNIFLTSIYQVPNNFPENVTPQTRGSVDYPSTRGILVNVG